VEAGYRTFDHTGDLGLEVWAGSPEALYAEAAMALMAQIAEVPRDAAEEGLAVSLDGDDAADLLVHWLNTALLEADVRGVVWTRASVTALSDHRLEASLEGTRLDPARHTLLREIKAVSFHDLELSLEPGRCRCRLVLDL
jgi:SHS2 domain-containing protein